MTKKLQITLVRSPISTQRRHRDTLRSLGLRKMHQTVEQPDNASIRGMVAQVNHLIEVKEIED